MPPSREQGKCAYYNVPAQAGFSPRNELVNWIRVCPMARGLRSAPVRWSVLSAPDTKIAAPPLGEAPPPARPTSLDVFAQRNSVVGCA